MIIAVCSQITRLNNLALNFLFTSMVCELYLGSNALRKIPGSGRFVNTECHASQCSHGQEAVMEATKNVQRMFFWAAKSRAKSPGAPLTQWHWALNRIYWSSPQKNAKRSRLTLQGDTISVDISASFWVRFGCDLFGVGSATFLQFFCGLQLNTAEYGRSVFEARSSSTPAHFFSRFRQ